MAFTIDLSKISGSAGSGYFTAGYDGTKVEVGKGSTVAGFFTVADSVTGGASAIVASVTVGDTASHGTFYVTSNAKDEVDISKGQTGMTVDGSAATVGINVAGGQSEVVTTGAGNDTIEVTAAGATVNAGAGADLISVTAENAVINAGAGDDSVVADKASTITLGEGADHISIKDDGVNVTDFGNGDVVTIEKGKTSSIEGSSIKAGTAVAVVTDKDGSYVLTGAGAELDGVSIVGNAELTYDTAKGLTFNGQALSGAASVSADGTVTDKTGDKANAKVGDVTLGDGASVTATTAGVALNGQTITGAASVTGDTVTDIAGDNANAKVGDVTLGDGVSVKATTGGVLVNDETVKGAASVDAKGNVTSQSDTTTYGNVTIASGVAASKVGDAIVVNNVSLTGAATKVTSNGDGSYTVELVDDAVIDDTVKAAATLKAADGGKAVINADGTYTYDKAVVTPDPKLDSVTPAANNAASSIGATKDSVTGAQSLPAAGGTATFTEDNVTVTGAEKGDADVSVTGNSAVVSLGDGNNHITVGANASVTSGKGNDYVSVDGANAKVTVGAGDDSVNVTGSNATVNADGGDNVIGVQGNDAVVTTGAGHDTITVVGTAANIAAGAGNNVIRATGKDASITAGDGRNTVTAGEEAKITLGNGNNKVAGFNKNTSVTLGNGRNTVYGSGDDATVTAGDGNNEIGLKSSSHSAVTTGAGRDYITVEGSDATISSGAGRDTISTTGADAVITGTDGDKSITAAAKNASVTVGNGRDTISVGDSATVTAGDGKDSITAGKDAVISTGAGDSTITAGTNSSIVTGAGKSSIVANTDTTVTAGAGKDTVAVTGKNVVFTDYELGTDTITGIDTTTAPTLTTDGKISDGTNDVTISTLTGGFYAVELGDSDTKDATNSFAWTTDDAAVVDGSGMKHGFTFYGNLNDDAADTVTGTKYDDSIVAGDNDVINAGKGDDKVTVAGDNVTVALAQGNGETTITGFKTGYEDDATTLAISGSIEKIKATKSSVSITGGSVSLAGGDVNKLKVSYAGTTYNAQIVDNSAVALDDEAQAIIGVDGGKDNTVSLTGDDNTTVDLSMGKAAAAGVSDSRYYKNVQVIDATSTEGDNILVGGDEKTTIKAGSGESSLWGGSSKADLLVGNTAASDVYFYGANDGNDSISGYTYSEDVKDVVNIMNADQFTGVKRDAAGNVKVSFKNGATTEKLTVSTTAANATDVDNKYAFTTNNGEAVAVAKVGLSGTANTFTYADDVDLYMGGKGNTVKVAADTDYATVDLTNGALKDLGFTGSTQQYENVSVIDASATAGDVVLAGSTAKNTIKASAGNSSLYGGFGGAADVLDATAAHESATFFYGKGDGNDTILGAGADDKVMLYDVSLGDINFEKSSVSGGVLALNNGAKLTVSGFENGTTFQLADGTSYAYDKTTGGFEQK